MNHADVRKLISSLRDGELDDAGKEVVAGHVKDCEGCRQYEQAVRSMSSGIRALTPFTLRQGFTHDVVRSVRQTTEESRLWSSVELVARRLVLALGAAVLVFVTLAMIVQREEPVVIEPYLAGEQSDSSAARTLLAKETISKDDILLAAVTR